MEAGRDVEEGLKMARMLEEVGFDALHVDAGCYDSWYWAHPPGYQKYGCMVDMAAEVKKVVKIPVIAVGRLDVPELAEKVIAEGKADLVAIGRGFLADPALGKESGGRPAKTYSSLCGLSRWVYGQAGCRKAHLLRREPGERSGKGLCPQPCKSVKENNGDWRWRRRYGSGQGGRAARAQGRDL